MATVTPKALEEFKKIYKEQYGKEFKSDVEALDSAQRLLNLFEVLLKCEHRERLRKQRLKDEPKGFHLEEDGSTYNCIICHKMISGKDGWWDLDGQKCLDCQRNIENGVVPRNICRDRDSWYASWQIQDKLKIHSSTVRKMVREGKLKARNLTTEGGTIYFQVFLLSENQDTIRQSREEKHNETVT
ncbi:MAG: hypothetical protein A3A51_00050 [Candidatus Levybacteria bacterium RIFCSPLOWO2_01_FULL_39_10]|nr:MAG: hypothetical protein A3A51_00050 [Candidatus Levybacteria bacterium RIFCSPLOWO2_01_FULL_39_10]